MIKHIVMLAIWVLFSITSSAQSVIIIDSKSNEPLVGVTISSKDELLISDENGRVDLSTFSDETLIEIRYLGYESIDLLKRELEDEQNLSLVKSAVQLDQVIVSATKWRQGRRHIPSKVSQIGQSEIELGNPQTAADLLGQSGEVFIQKSQQGGGSPMIRGFSTNRLLYAVDGVRMNTAIFRSGNLHNVISLDPLAMESTEILFGPGSVIYGSDAIGGVMSFTTLMPKFSEGSALDIDGNGMFRYASANEEKTGHFDLNLGWKKWAAVTSVSFNDFGDLKMGSHGPDEYLRSNYVERIDDEDVVISNDNPLIQRFTGYEQYNLMQKLAFQPNEDWTFDLSAHYSTTGNFPRYDRLIRTRGGQPRSAEWNYGPQIWSMVNFTVNYQNANGIFDKSRLTIARQSFEESRIDRNFQSVMRSHTEEAVDAYSANLDFFKQLKSNWRLYYGLESVLNTVESNGLSENIETAEVSIGPSRYPQADWLSHALYASTQYLVNSKFDVSAGLRYNLYSIDADFSGNLDFYPFEESMAKLEDGALSGSLGFLYRPTAKSTLSLNLSSGFRAPNVDDIGKVFDSEPGSVVVPNPDLKAEQAYNIEIGWAQLVGNDFKFDMTLYYTYLADALVRRDFTLNGRDSIEYNGELSQVQAIQNAAFATVMGVQVGTEWKFAPGWSWINHFNYQKGEEELDDGSTSPSRHAAPMFGKTLLKYVDERIKLELDFTASAERSFDDMPISEIGKDYLYAIDSDGNPYSPSWYTINLHGYYQLSDQLEFGAGIENITDQRYRTYSSGIAAPGRNFVMSIKAKI